MRKVTAKPTQARGRALSDRLQQLTDPMVRCSVATLDPVGLPIALEAAEVVGVIANIVRRMVASAATEAENSGRQHMVPFLAALSGWDDRDCTDAEDVD